MAQTMLFELVHNTLVVVHGADAPSDIEWGAWLERMGHVDYTSVLIVTDGGAPTPRQRTLTNEFWHGRDKPKMAVVSDSALVRGAIFAFYWLFKGDMRPFSPSHQTQAFDFLGVELAHRGDVARISQNLHERIRFILSSKQSAVA